MSFIDPLYPVFLATGFAVGFGHCIGMCGPIVVSLSLNLKDKNLLIPHLLYNSGRVVTYVVLGKICKGRKKSSLSSYPVAVVTAR